MSVAAVSSIAPDEAADAAEPLRTNAAEEASVKVSSQPPAPVLGQVLICQVKTLQPEVGVCHASTV